MYKLQLARRIVQCLCALGITLAGQTAHAAWQINSSGTGAAGATQISTVANVGGVGFVQIAPDPATGQLSFVEHGAYQLQQANSSAQEITVIYSVAGYLSSTMAPTFTSGSISLFADSNNDFGSTNGNFGADNGSALASFAVIGGGAISSSEVALQASLTAGTLLHGYFFDANGGDMADAADVMLNLVVKNQPAQPDSQEVAEIVCGLSAYAGPGCDSTPFANSQQSFFVKDGGNVSLTAIPEPGSMALFVAALGGLSLFRRRHLAARS